MVIEIIKRIQKQQAEKATAEEAVKEATAERERLEREAAERLRQQKEEERRLFVNQQTEKVLQESFALDGLQRIERELLEGNVEKHSLVYNPDKAKAVLAWGNGFSVTNGEIKEETYHDYSTISVEVNPDVETLLISGKENYQFKKSQWKNKNAIDDALANAYLDPIRNIERPYSGGSSSNDDSGCCCCSGH